MRAFIRYSVLLQLLQLWAVARAATLLYHQPMAVVYHHASQPSPATAGEEQPHPGYTIVAPLTKIAHVTYDSLPVPHTPFEHVPLFQRIGHAKMVQMLRGSGLVNA